jgi:hypothetical protein
MPIDDAAPRLPLSRLSCYRSGPLFLLLRGGLFLRGLQVDLFPRLRRWTDPVKLTLYCSGLARLASVRESVLLCALSGCDPSATPKKTTNLDSFQSRSIYAWPPRTNSSKSDGGQSGQRNAIDWLPTPMSFETIMYHIQTVAMIRVLDIRLFCR